MHNLVTVGVFLILLFGGLGLLLAGLGVYYWGKGRNRNKRE
jgi:hypothetical protein